MCRYVACRAELSDDQGKRCALTAEPLRFLDKTKQKLSSFATSTNVDCLLHHIDTSRLQTALYCSVTIALCGMQPHHMDMHRNHHGNPRAATPGHHSRS